MDGFWAASPSACSSATQCNAELNASFFECVAAGECQVDEALTRLVGVGRLAACSNGLCTCNPTFWVGGPWCLDQTGDTIKSAAVFGSMGLLALVSFAYGLYPLVVLQWHRALPFKASEATCMYACVALLSLAVFDAIIVYKHFSRGAYLEYGIYGVVAAVAVFTIMAYLRLALTWINLASRAELLAAYSNRLNRSYVAVYVLAGVWVSTTALSLILRSAALAAVACITFALCLGLALLFGSSAMFFQFQDDDRPVTCFDRLAFFASALCASHYLIEPPTYLRTSSIVQVNESKHEGMARASTVRPPQPVDERHAFRMFARRIIRAAYRINTLVLVFVAGIVAAIVALREDLVERSQSKQLFWSAIVLVQVSNSLGLAVLFWFFRKSYLVRIANSRRRLHRGTQMRMRSRHTSASQVPETLHISGEASHGSSPRLSSVRSPSVRAAPLEEQRVAVSVRLELDGNE